MSEADRRQIQKMLQGMSYYKGPINGKFGPLTRAAIRRYQDSIGLEYRLLDGRGGYSPGQYALTGP